jgi:hypothetical protein
MAPRYIFCHRRSTSSGSLPDQEITQSPGEGVRRRRVDDCPRDLRRRVDLADAVDALVRADANDQVVLAAIGDRAVEAGLPDDDRFDVGDPHEAAPPRDYR